MGLNGARLLVTSQVVQYDDVKTFCIPAQIRMSQHISIPTTSHKSQSFIYQYGNNSRCGSGGLLSTGVKDLFRAGQYLSE